MRFERRADGVPHVSEGAFDVTQRRPTHFNACIPPGRDTALLVAYPHVADAKTGDEAYAAIDGEHLAVVAMEHVHRTREFERIERTHFHARIRERAPEAARRLANRAEPVVHQANANACAGAFRQRGSELAPDAVVADEV